MTTSSGSSVLSNMVAGVMAQKAGRTPTTTLTPTVLEAPTKVGPLIPNHPILGTLPDDPDFILQSLARARSEAESAIANLQTVLESIGRLEVAWGDPAKALVAEATTDAVLTEREKQRRAQDQAIVASVGPNASKADLAKAEAAAARLATAKPIEDVEATLAARLDAKVEQVAAVTPDVTKEDLTERMARLQAEATAAVFGNPTPRATPAPEPEPDEDDDEDEDEAPKPQPADGWVCPKHGAEEISTRVSPRRQVTFRTCQVAGCGLFEKV